MRMENRKSTIRRRAAMALAFLMGIGNCLCPVDTQAAIRDDIKVVDLLDEERFDPDETNIKVSSEDPAYPGVNALCGDGINYWKNGSEGIYKTKYEPSALFWAVDLGDEKTIESAYIVLANEAQHLNLTLDKVNAKNLSNKFEIVYTSDDDIWNNLPEPSNEVCEYSWEDEGWQLAGGTETEGLWSNTQLNGKDWACDTKTFHHPFTARYVMVYITLLGEDDLPDSHDLGLVDLQLFGHDAIVNDVEIYPETTEYFRAIQADVSTEFPEDETVKSVSYVTIPRTLEKASSGNAQKNSGTTVKLAKGKDYDVYDSQLVLFSDYLQTLPPADNQFIIKFESGAEAMFTVSVTSKSGTYAFINAVPGISPFTVLGEGLGTDEPVEGATKRIRAALPQAESHIINLFDKDLGKYVISLQAHDNDCRIGCYAHKANYNQTTGELVDGDNSRQRIEIRPSTDSGMDLVAVDGEITKYNWKWRIADNYPVTGSFNHIFQLKAVNGQRNGTLDGFTDPVMEHSKAIFTFTAVTKGLQLRYNDKVVIDQGGKEVSIPMDKVRGRWIDVSLEMLHADEGWVKVKVTDHETGEVLMDYEGNHDTWRRPEQKDVGELDYPACFDQYNRPKWGIYRKGNRDETDPKNSPVLKASHIELADLTITKNGEEEEYITSISLQKPDKLNYMVGEDLNTSGMIVTATMSNAQARELDESEYEITGFDSSEEGEKTVAVTVTTHLGEKEYRLTKRFTVSVKEGTFYTDKMYVSKKPDKMTYYTDEDFDPTGMEVKVLMKASDNNASYEEKLNEDAYEVNYSFDKTGKSTVTVVYTGTDSMGEDKIFKDSFDVTVKERPEGDVTDKSELRALVADCEEITNDNYTMSSWNRFLKALNQAKDVLKNEKATQKQVDKALSALSDALEGLREKNDSFDDDSSDDDDSSYDNRWYNRHQSTTSRPTASGTWQQDQKGWRCQKPDGTYMTQTWSLLDWNGTPSWYFFDQDGYMVSGWFQWNGNRYYLHPQSDNTKGHMYVGWHLIDGAWYYFNKVEGSTEGALLTGTVTPDGYTVDANGVWVK